MFVFRLDSSTLPISGENNGDKKENRKTSALIDLKS